MHIHFVFRAGLAVAVAFGLMGCVASGTDHMAVLQDPEAFETVVGGDLDLAARDENDLTLAEVVAGGGSAEQLRQLLDAGAELDGGVHSTAPLLNTVAMNPDNDPGNAKMRMLLEAGADVNRVDPNGRGALHEAAESGTAEQVALLIENGADLDLVDEQRWTPLYLSARTPDQDSDARKVRLLLDAGADPNIATVEGWTPLIAAARYADADTMRLLLDAGADGTARTADGWSALHFAARHPELDPQMKKLRMALAHGAEADGQNDERWTPLLLAARYGDAQRVALLIEAGANVDQRESSGWSAVYFAARHPELDPEARKVRLLLDAGANPDFAAGDNDWTALHAAARHGHVEAVEWLLEAGANTNRVTSDGWSALHLLVRYAEADPDAEKLRLILAARAEVDVQLPSGATPLVTAVRYGTADQVRLLLAAGADPNATVDGGWTPLLRAARYGSSESVQRLLDAGADPDRVTNDGWSALHQLARNPEADPDAEKLRSILAAEAEVDVRFPNGSTPLLTAARYGTADQVRLLLAAGADPNTTNDNGWSPVHRASRYGNGEQLGLLLAAGGDANRTTSGDSTPLGLVNEADQERKRRYLVAAGARPPQQGSQDSAAGQMLGALVGAGWGRQMGMSNQDALRYGRNLTEGLAALPDGQSGQGVTAGSREEQALAAYRASILDARAALQQQMAIRPDTRNGQAPATAGQGEEEWEQIPAQPMPAAGGGQGGNPLMANFAGVYASEHTDNRFAYHHFILREDGSAVLCERACDSCIGTPHGRDWYPMRDAISWTPSVDANGEVETSRVSHFGRAFDTEVLLIEQVGADPLRLHVVERDGRRAIHGPYQPRWFQGANTAGVAAKCR